MTDKPPNSTPSVVLVHGGFADSSGWKAVIERLRAARVPVRAIVNPLRGLVADSAYVASAIKQIIGPVLAVGHSYGGAVITNAASAASNVVGLVYVAAFIPKEGESLMDIGRGSKDSVLNSALVQLEYPVGSGRQTELEFMINPDQFRNAFAADLSIEEAAIMAITQRPIAALSFTEVSGPPAWKRLPSWAVVPTGDQAAGSDVLRSMAQRAGATVIEARGSHVIMMSQPQIVTDMILHAIDSVRSRPYSAGGRT